jgi:hypothetical protein
VGWPEEVRDVDKGLLRQSLDGFRRHFERLATIHFKRGDAWELVDELGNETNNNNCMIKQAMQSRK